MESGIGNVRFIREHSFASNFGKRVKASCESDLRVRLASQTCDTLLRRCKRVRQESALNSFASKLGSHRRRDRCQRRESEKEAGHSIV